MYTNKQNAAALTAAESAKAQRLADLRFMVLDTVNYSPFATAEEKARTAASVARCQSADVLVKWYCNVLTLLSERELAAPGVATAEQKQQIVRLLNHPAVTRRHKNRVLAGIDRLTGEAAAREINRLTAYVANPFGGGAAVNAVGELVWVVELTA